MTVLFYKDGRLLTDEGNPLEGISLEGLLACIVDPKPGQVLKHNGGMFVNAEQKLLQSIVAGKAYILNGPDSQIIEGVMVDVVGIPTYVSDVSEFSEYGITETGWYVFATIPAPEGVTVSASTTVTGAAGSIVTVGENHVDVAVAFDVAAQASTVTVDWDGATEQAFIFRAPDLAVRNLDYRTTFYVYDADDFVTWEYVLTADETFAADKDYYTLDNGVYTKATVTAGEAVPADTYYNHSKCIISGLARNITYKLDQVIDCPMEFILPEIEDETHGCWYEIRCIHAGEYSMTLTPPDETVKIATEHTQKETKGVNMIDLHYTYINGIKLWRFLNTHSSIPEAAAAAATE